MTVLHLKSQRAGTAKPMKPTMSLRPILYALAVTAGLALIVWWWMCGG
jgi:hypothetical protein